MITVDVIVNVLRKASVGLTARQIANILHEKRKDVNSTLYMHQDVVFYRDSDYLWYCMGDQKAKSDSVAEDNRKQTVLLRNKGDLNMLKPNFNPLWHLLIDRKMKKIELQRQAGISSATLAKMVRDDWVALEVIARVCKALNCTPNDILKFDEVKEG